MKTKKMKLDQALAKGAVIQDGYHRAAVALSLGIDPDVEVAMKTKNAVDMIECDWCDGQGAFSNDYSRSVSLSDPGSRACSRCHGTGKVVAKDFGGPAIEGATIKGKVEAPVKAATPNDRATLMIEFTDGRHHKLVRRIWPDTTRRLLHYIDVHDNRVWTTKMNEVASIWPFGATN